MILSCGIPWTLRPDQNDDDEIIFLTCNPRPLSGGIINLQIKFQRDRKDYIRDRYFYKKKMKKIILSLLANESLVNSDLCVFCAPQGKFSRNYKIIFIFCSIDISANADFVFFFVLNDNSYFLR